MKLALNLAAGCAIAIAAPASAQILGGSGAGGLGGSLGGAGGQIGGQLGGTLGSVTRTTRGTADAAADAEAQRKVDRRSGRADARARGNARGNGALDVLGRSANAGGGGSGNADVGAQAIGTDAVRGTARSTLDRTRATMRGTGGGTAASAGGGAGGSIAGGSAHLAAAGSAAANSAGAISVSPGMIVRDTSGRAIGRVQAVRARANGLVDNVIVRVGDRLASLPDENFSANGNVLVSAMSQADLSSAAGAQAARGQSQGKEQGRSQAAAQRGRDRPSRVSEE